MPLLPAVGVVSYNGFVFGPETRTLSVNAKPIPDAAGRTISRTKYTFTIESKIIVTAASGLASNDSTLDTIRRTLLVYGGEFVYTSKGLGTITINSAAGGGQRDMNWGPKVEQLSWVPLGGNLAGTITLELSYETLDCSGAQFQFGIMELGYKMSFSQGRDRLTRRTYSGYLKIPQTRTTVNDRFPKDSADLYFEEIWIPPPIGWRREEESRTVDESRTRLDFSFTDVMLEAPLERGTIEMDWDHEQSNIAPVQMNQKQGRISATYKMALGENMALAEIHFKNLIVDKLLAQRAAGTVIILRNYTAHEHGMTRTANFSASYHAIRGHNILGIILNPPIFGSQGFWRASPTANHISWSQRLLASNATAPRGYSQDVVRPEQDVIVDLCLPSGPETPEPGLAPTSLPPDDIMSVFAAECPGPEFSWIEWSCAVEIDVDDGISEHKPLPLSPLPEPTYTPGGPGFTTPDGFKPVDPALNTTQPPMILQQRTTPTVHVSLVGYAVRICYDIPAPIVESVGGVPAVAVNREGREFYRTGIYGNMGVPIRWAMWRRRFVLAEAQPSDCGPIEGPLVPNSDFTMGEPQGPDEGTGE